MDEAAAPVISRVGLAADGAVLGLTIAYVAVRSLVKLKATSIALHKINNAPSLHVSDLPSLLSSPNQQTDNNNNGTLVIVRGTVEPKSAVDATWKRLINNNNNSVLVSHQSGERGVILQTTQTVILINLKELIAQVVSCVKFVYIYNESRGFFESTSRLCSIFSRSWKKHESSSLRTVPFILVEGGKWPHSDLVIVNMDGSRHPLPLTTVYHNLQPVTATPYTFLQALFGHEYPVGLLDEEKILPVGKDITAVGTCCLKNGTPVIKSCNDLPYFLSDMAKDQMLVVLTLRTKVLLWSGVILGSFALGILGYAAVRNWNKWKDWRQQRRIQRQNAAAIEADTQSIGEEETGDLPDGELCVICLMRRRRSAFIPCGHMVCCQRCALSVERELAPKCPVCRQPIRNSVRIYDS